MRSTLLPLLAALVLAVRSALGSILPLPGTCATQLNMCDGGSSDAPSLFPRGAAARLASPVVNFTPPLIVPLRNTSTSATRVTRRTSRSPAQAVVPPVNPSVDLSAAADPLTGTIMVVSGNEAMGEMMVNLAASVSLLTQPFPFFLAPLDQAAYDTVVGNTQVPGVKVLQDSHALRRFSAPAQAKRGVGGNGTTAAALSRNSTVAAGKPPAAAPPPASPASALSRDRPSFVREARSTATDGAGGRASEAKYGEARFNALARYKWELARAVVATGRPALISDPDIVFFRDPFPYLASIPPCDLTFQAEVAGVAHLFPHRIASKLSPTLRRYLTGHIPFPYGWVNSGFMLFRPSHRLDALIDAITRFFPVSDTLSFADPRTGKPRPRGDQSILSLLLSTQYELDVGEAGERLYGSGEEVDGAPGGGVEENFFANASAKVRRAMQRGTCLRLVRNRTSHPAGFWMPGVGRPEVEAILNDLPSELSMWILNPALFPTYPIATFTDLCEAAMEPPYLLHYNWMKGVRTKKATMAEACHWHLKETGAGERGGSA